MIVFDLQCSCGFLFEGWFRDHEDFDEQAASGLLICPDCGAGGAVRRVLSPVMYRKGDAAAATPQNSEEGEASPPQLEEALHQLQRYVEEHFEDVGTRFAATSLKMHFGVEEPKNIRGVVSREEEELLRREGVGFAKIPLPERKEEQSH